jgi:uncharacterized membrane protein (DUF106 family)
MSKSSSESAILFKPLLTAGIIILAFGIICIWIGTSVISLKEEGEGFKIIGTRFLVGAAVSIGLGFLAKYFTLIKYILRQFLDKKKPEDDKYSDWYRP